MSTTIPILQSKTRVFIPGVGERYAECLAGGYVFNCCVPSDSPPPSNEYKPTLGIRISTVIVGQNGWVPVLRAIDITPDQRNAAIAQWWLDNCFPTIRKVLEQMTDAEEDIANAFGWWLSNKKFIQVGGWERDVWRGFAMDILNKVTENHMTFHNAAGIN